MPDPSSPAPEAVTLWVAPDGHPVSPSHQRSARELQEDGYRPVEYVPAPSGERPDRVREAAERALYLLTIGKHWAARKTLADALGVEIEPLSSVAAEEGAAETLQNPLQNSPRGSLLVEGPSEKAIKAGEEVAGRTCRSIIRRAAEAMYAIDSKPSDLSGPHPEGLKAANEALADWEHADPEHTLKGTKRILAAYLAIDSKPSDSSRSSGEDDELQITPTKSKDLELGEGLHLSRADAEALYRVLVEKPTDSAAWAAIADRVYAFLANSDGSGERR